MNKYIKYGLLIAVIALLGYKSVYFEKLSTRKNNTAAAFDAVGFSKKLWEEKMPAKMDSAVQLTTLINAINKEGETAINKYTNALAIGNYRYALVKLDGTVTDVKEDEVLISVKHNDSLITVNLATEFVYGNAIRDASGLVQVKDFPNTNDLNSVSEELNKIIRSGVLPSFKSAIKKDDKVNIVAALQINKEHIHWQGIELLPVRLQIVQ
jgi:predicted lipoprotein